MKTTERIVNFSYIPFVTAIMAFFSYTTTNQIVSNPDEMFYMPRFTGNNTADFPSIIVFAPMLIGFNLLFFWVIYRTLQGKPFKSPS